MRTNTRNLTINISKPETDNLDTISVSTFCNKERTLRYLKSIALYLYGYHASVLPKSPNENIMIEITPLVATSYCFTIRSPFSKADTENLLHKILVDEEVNVNFLYAEPS